MKKTKRLIALALVLVMALALMVPVMADGEPDGYGDLTIEKTVAGETYTVYRVLDATWDGGTGYAYAVNEYFVSFFQDIPSIGTKTGTALDNAAVEYINGLDNHGKRAFATDLAKYVNEKHISPAGQVTASNITAVITHLPYGYYLMEPTSGTTPNPDGSILFSLNTLTESATIENKTEYPTPTKLVSGPDDNSNYSETTFAGVGNTVSFKVEGTVKHELLDAYDKYYFAIHDKMNHLTYAPNSAKIYINNTLVAQQIGGIIVKEDGVTQLEGVTLTWDSETKKLDVIITDLKPFYTKGNNIVGRLEYDATVDTDAVIGSAGNINEVTFEYSNDPTSNGKGESIPSETKTYVLKLTLKKTKADGTTALTGSNWKLQKSVGGTWTDVQEITSTDISTFVFNGIGEGEYQLIETKAPDGYQAIQNPIQFTVNATGTIEGITGLDFHVNTHSYVVNSSSVANAGTVELTVKNTQHSVLPATGGAGLYVVAGVALLALLAFGGTAFAKKRLSAEK